MPNKNNKQIPIFDAIERNDGSHRKNQESYFHFLNRSSRKEIGVVRDLIQDFFARYPSEHTQELITRIRSGNDTSFLSSTFELFLHEALTKLGCRLSPHPALTNDSNARPDFLVTLPDGSDFYLEAVLASEHNDSDEGAQARKGVVFDTLANNPHKNFMIDIDDYGDPARPPSGKRLVQEIHQWLDSLDPDRIQQTISTNGIDSISPFKWAYEGWEICCRPIPLRIDKRGKCKNLIAAMGGEGGFVDAWSPIRDAIKRKGRKYGSLDKPLLIAVNLNSFTLDRIDEMQALYGQEQFIYGGGNPENGPRMERAPNGAWFGRNGPQYTRVSGAWIFNDMHPTSLARRRQAIYFNPWAVHPLPDLLKIFPHAIAENGIMRWYNGALFSELYGLDEGWPE